MTTERCIKFSFSIIEFELFSSFMYYIGLVRPEGRCEGSVRVNGEFVLCGNDDMCDSSSAEQSDCCACRAQFSWIDGQRSVYQPWANGEPQGGSNHHCGALIVTVDGQPHMFGDIDCRSSSMRKICKQPIGKKCLSALTVSM